MPVVSPFREGLIAHGNCVDVTGNRNADLEAFAAADAGSRDPSVLAAAQLACVSSCAQFDKCFSQRELLATALWRRGAGLAVAGGEQIEITVAGADEVLDMVTLDWDMRRIPLEPAAALNIIRQSIRSSTPGQLDMRGTTPRGAKAEATNYAKRLLADDPDFYSDITVLLGEEANVATEYIITALCQQKDWKAFSQQKGKGGNPKTTHRYDSGTLNPKVADPIIKQFLRDTLEIKSLGYSLPANKALQFTPKYYELLKTKFKTDEISWSDFDRVVTTYRKNPAGALQRRSGRQHRIRAEQPEAPEAFTRRAARDNADVDFGDRVSEIHGRFGDEHVTEGIVRYALMRSPTNPEKFIREFNHRIAKGVEKYGLRDRNVRETDIVAFARNTRDTEAFMRTLSLYGGNVRRLKRLYEDDPDFPDEIIRRISRACINLKLEDEKYPGVAVDAAEAYVVRVADLRKLSEGEISDAFVRQYCAQSNRPINFKDAKKAYNIQLLRDRLNKRATDSTEEIESISTQILRRIVTLYTESEIGSVADTVFELLQSGLVVCGRGDMQELRDSTWQDDLDKIFDPKDKSYLTFSTAFEDMNSTERFIFAHYHNLVPLLYGLAPNGLKLEHEVLTGGTLAQYYNQRVASKITEIMDHAEHPELPMAIHRVNRDVMLFKGLLKKNDNPFEPDITPLEVDGLQNAIIVSGGRVFQLRERDKVGEWQELSRPMREWVEHKVRSSYPPQTYVAALEYVQNALRSGVLTILGSSPKEFRVTFSNAFYDESTSDLDRAIVAHEMRLDRLLYGSDLSVVLESRKGRNERVVAVRRSKMPILIDITETVLPNRPIKPAIASKPRRVRGPSQRDRILPEACIAVYVRSLQTPRNDYGSIMPSVMLPRNLLRALGVARGGTIYRQHFDSYRDDDQVTVISADPIIGNGEENFRRKITSLGLITMPSALGVALTNADESKTPVGLVGWSGERRAVITSQQIIDKRLGKVSLTGLRDAGSAKLAEFKRDMLACVTRHHVILDTSGLGLTPAELMTDAFPELAAQVR